MQPPTRFHIEQVEEVRSPAGQMDLPPVTIVILSFNRKEQLRINLGKVTAELDYPSNKKEIIVVENASTDGSAEMVRAEFPSVTLLVQPKNIGISGWNAGFIKGKGEFFLALDDDCYLEGDALRVAVVHAMRYSADIVSFTVLNPYENGFSFNQQHNMGLMSFWGCAVLISKSSVDALAGFDPGIFVYVHEAEFCMRAFDRGFKHLFLPSVKAWHMKSTSGKPSSKALERTFRSGAYIVVKRFSSPLHISMFARFLLAACKAGKHDLKNWLKYVCAVLAGGRRGFADREPVGHAVSDAYAEDYMEFLNPLKYGGPRHHEKMAAFYAERPQLYSLDRPATIQFVS